MRNFARALLSTLEQYKLKLTESENEVQHLKECLKKQNAHVTDMENKLVELRRNPRSWSSNSFVEECKTYHKHDTVVLPNENGTPLSSETSGKNETNHDAEMVDTSLLDTINEVYRCELPLPVNQTALQQLEIPAEGYSSLTMEESSMDISYQHPDGNSKSLQKNVQSDAEVGDVGCSLHIFGNEEISIMQAEMSLETSGKNKTDHDVKMVDASLFGTITEVDRCELPLPVNQMALPQKIMVENVTLADNVQQTAPSHSTEVLKCKENDPALKPLNSQRPRRKLLPASAIMLKEFNGLFMDENVTEVKSKRTANVEGRSDGNVSLIQIFKSNLQR